MDKNIRIPIDLNSEETRIQINIEQEFDNLEILSLNISNEDIYTRSGSDFGVVVGRVMLNNGFGVQNAKVNVFIPITDDDRLRNEILELYPFETITDTYPNGVRYNLLPRIRNSRNPSHRAVGNFPDKTDFTHYPQYLEIMDKYYKYTTTTNQSGDYMIFGVPVGERDIVMDFDIFDTESLDLTANDLVQQITLTQGIDALREQLNTVIDDNTENIISDKVPGFIYLGNNNYDVELSTDLDSMPNIFHQVKQVSVSSFWGDDEYYDVGITRCDFKINFKYTPTAVFFGYVHSPSGGFHIRPDYSVSTPKPLEIPGIDTSLNTTTGDLYPMQEMNVVVYRLDSDLTIGSRKRLGVFKSSRYSGVFKINLPMYMDYYITDEFGDLIPTKDTSLGLPTKGYYAFEIYDSNEFWNGRRLVQGGYNNAILPGIRIPSSISGDQYLGGWEGTWTGLFEYDIINNRRKFYTIKTKHFKHNPNNVLLSGNDITYFPSFNNNKENISWNFPINRGEVSLVDEPTIIGSVLIPRVLTTYTNNTFLDPNKILDVPWVDVRDSFGVWVQSYECYLGLGVTNTGGKNFGDIFQNAVNASEYLTTDNDGNIINYYGIRDTWNYGDNSEDLFVNRSLFALDKSRNKESNANEFGVHKAYNQAVYSNNTFGVFINSSEETGTGKFPMIEVSIYDITDELSDLIINKVYSSYNKSISLANINPQFSVQIQNEDLPDIFIESSNSVQPDSPTINNFKNTYKGKFYYFGLYNQANALAEIEKFYFIR